MSKQTFLDFPTKEHATGVFSLGEPGGGKTYIMLKCLNEWIKQNIFKEIHLVLPSYKNEKNDSYKDLETIGNVFIYDSYHKQISEQLIRKSDKNNDAVKKGRAKVREMYFLGIDDATSQGKSLMECKDLIRIATEGRHLNIQSWFCLHHTAGIIPPKVRSQTKFTFFYNMHAVALRTCWKEYVNFPEFRNFKDFLEFWDEYVISKAHGVLLVQKNVAYNPTVCDWFNENENKISPSNISNRRNAENTQ